MIVPLSAGDAKSVLELSQAWGLPFPETLRRCLQIAQRLPELARAYERTKLPRPKLIGPRASERRDQAAKEAKFDAACTIAEVVSYELAMVKAAVATG